MDAGQVLQVSVGVHRLESHERYWLYFCSLLVDVYYGFLKLETFVISVWLY